METASPPIAERGSSAVVTPRQRCPAGCTSVSSSTNAAVGIAEQAHPGQPSVKAGSRCRCRSAIFITASATPPMPAVQAATALPLRRSVGNRSTGVQQRMRFGQAVLVVLRRQQADRVTRRLEFRGDDFAAPGRWRRQRRPSVGGTSRSSKVPDMESLPPMAATPSSIWASRTRPAVRQGACPSARGPCRRRFKVFLEGQVGILVGRAGGDQLGNGLHHRQVRAVIGVRCGDDTGL